MRSRLKLVTLLASLTIGAAAMAAALRFVSIGIVLLVTMVNAIAIASVVLRKPDTSSEGRAKRKTMPIIWPLALLLGAALEISDARREGWKVGDTVGVVVCVLVLAALFLAYRKQRAPGSGS
jgi:hypothetical protein